jgi:hypothetical protein
VLLWLDAGDKTSPLISAPGTPSKQQLPAQGTLPSTKARLGRQETARELGRTRKQETNSASSPTSSTSVRPVLKTESQAVVSLPPNRVPGIAESDVRDKLEEHAEKSDALSYEPDFASGRVHESIDNIPVAFENDSVVLAPAPVESIETVKESGQSLYEAHSSSSSPEKPHENPKIPDKRYLDLVQSRISSRWIEPPGTPHVGPLDVLVHFRLVRS